MAGYSKTFNIGKTGYLYLHIYGREERGIKPVLNWRKYNQKSYFWHPQVTEIKLQIFRWTIKLHWKRILL